MLFPITNKTHKTQKHRVFIGTVDALMQAIPGASIMFPEVPAALRSQSMAAISAWLSNTFGNAQDTFVECTFLYSEESAEWRYRAPSEKPILGARTFWLPESEIKNRISSAAQRRELSQSILTIKEEAAARKAAEEKLAIRMAEEFSDVNSIACTGVTVELRKAISAVEREEQNLLKCKNNYVDILLAFSKQVADLNSVLARLSTDTPGETEIMLVQTSAARPNVLNNVAHALGNILYSQSKLAKAKKHARNMNGRIEALKAKYHIVTPPKEIVMAATAKKPRKCKLKTEAPLPPVEDDICPSCGASVALEHAVCPHCWYVLAH